MKKKKIVVWNCANTGNLGDDLVHLGMVNYIKKHFEPEYEISRAIFKLNPLTALDVDNAHLLLIGGGQLLDRTDFLENMAKFYRNGRLRTPFQFLGVGVGTPDDIRPYAEMLKKYMVYFAARDEYSLKIMQGEGFGDISRLYGDLTKEIDFKLIPYEARPFLAMNLKNLDKGVGYYRKLNSLLKKKDYSKLMFLSFNGLSRQKKDVDGEEAWVSDCDDSEHFSVVSKGLKEIISVTYGEKPFITPEKISGYYSKIGGIVAERYHAVVLADRFGIPFRAISYHGKVRRYLEMVGKEDLIIDPDPESVVSALDELSLSMIWNQEH